MCFRGHNLHLLSCQLARGWVRLRLRVVWGSSSPSLVCLSLPSCVPAEAAIRSIRQAQAEDLARVDVDQLEKVLPQLLLDF